MTPGDDDQDVAADATLSVTFSVDMDGESFTASAWQLLGPGNRRVDATIAYNAATATEGDGVAVEVTASAGNGEIQADLDNLKASTTFLVMARVKPTAGDVCEITTAGAATNIATTAAAGVLW